MRTVANAIALWSDWDRLQDRHAGKQMMGILSASDGLQESERNTTENFDSHGKPKTDPVFDGWLKHHLSQLYDPIIDEPIPADLLRLLEERLG